MKTELLDNAGKISFPLFDIAPELPYYLDFVDEDIRKMFEGRQYFSYEPLLAQLIKELRKLNAK